MSSSKPFILVDGSSYLYRAFHALPSLANSEGFPTGAIYGVVNMLRKLLSEYKPEYMAVVFDAKGKTFREELFPAYKAQRPAMPSELIQQIEPLHTLIKAMGLPLIMIEGVEADDVIGTLATLAAEKEYSVLISTGDKDLAQLVNEKVTLVNTMTNTFLKPQSVQEKFGVPPELIIDYLALIGDVSDNVPGVPQVGPKTAAKWLKEYGSLDQIMSQAASFSGKVGETLRASLTYLPLSRTLVTIKKDLSLPLALSELRLKEPDTERLRRLFKELEFKNWLAALLESDAARLQEERLAQKSYETIYTVEALDQWCARLTKAKFFAFDTETTSLNTMMATLVGFSFSTEAGAAAYLPVGHDYPGAPVQLPRELVLKKLKPLLEDRQVAKVGHNLKYDIEVLAQAGITMQGIAFDTMLESYILDSASPNHDMHGLALKYLGQRTIHYEDLAGKGAKQITFNAIPLAEASSYAAEDADVTWQLHQFLYPRLEKEKGLQFIYEKIEMPLVPVLARMERHGVLIDANKLQLQSRELEKRLQVLEEQAIALAGKVFNLNSPKQLQQVLFEDLKIPVLQKTPTGQPSTAEAVLQELAHDYPLPELIIEYRGLSKLISTYTNKLPEQINPQTGRIHTSYNQTGAATGRLSSSDPNLQNIPIRTLEGRRIRQAFIAAPGYKILSADYSQIELRLIAHISEDPNLVAAFIQNQDVHQATAAEVFELALREVSSEQRRAAKAINFGLIYGMSAFGLARQLKIDRQDAQLYIDRYFQRYPQVKAYIERTKQKAHEQGYVETWWGRRLYLPELHSSQAMRQKAAERAAINAPLQGSAADIIKMAMIHLDAWLENNKVDAKMIMQVHDELVVEVAEKELDRVLAAVKKQMTEVVSLTVPLTVSIGYGNNWDEAQEAGV
ncbi:MAG TPA: DNA polymerase I [Gammaproteobacteria bacterium]|nr:DNA polymerase I [Gammaproteobacteria bacterium]